MYNLKMDILVNEWQEGNYDGCVATVTQNYVSHFACVGEYDEVAEALQQIVAKCISPISYSDFFDEIAPYIDDVGVNDSSEGSYMIAETVNGNTEVYIRGNTEAYMTNFANLICEMAHSFDIEPEVFLSDIKARVLANASCKTSH